MLHWIKHRQDIHTFRRKGFWTYNKRVGGYKRGESKDTVDEDRVLRKERRRVPTTSSETGANSIVRDDRV
jgi:hypothetical protein